MNINKKINEINAKTFPLPLLLYNDQCHFCRRFKQALEKIPGTKKINMVSLHQREVFEVFAELNLKECQEVVHLIDRDRKVYRGPEVAQFLIMRFPAVRKISWLLESEMGKKAVNLFYQFTEKCKKSLSKNCPNC